jgi:hypothetical protein
LRIRSFAFGFPDGARFHGEGRSRQKRDKRKRLENNCVLLMLWRNAQLGLRGFVARAVA